MKKSMKLTGFTLAEALITLGIIGVVAVLTIPNLINKYQKHHIETNLKRSYSILSQALKLSIAENEDPDGWNFPKQNTEEEQLKFLETYIFPHLKIILNCKATNGHCWSEPEYLMNNNKTVVIANSKYIIRFKTIDNISIAYFTNITNGSQHFYVDVNGSRKPNTRGKDIFEFILAENKFLPKGYDLTKDEAKEECYYDKGYSCSRVLMDNNFKFPADYPW